MVNQFHQMEMSQMKLPKSMRSQKLVKKKIYQRPQATVLWMDEKESIKILVLTEVIIIL